MLCIFERVDAAGIFWNIVKSAINKNIIDCNYHLLFLGPLD
jgi:hypothetical protein